jgi:hypothetical protein
LKPEDLGQLFTTFRHSAFRLETLTAYAIEEEAESLRAWRAGEPRPAWYEDREWCRLVADATAAGKFMQRVRVVRRPLSDYIRLELDWGYPQNVEAGEDIRILELAGDDQLPSVPDPDRGYDFWCFDAVTVVRLEYDGAGRFVGVVGASEHASRFVACQDYAMRRAVPFSDYRATIF